MFNMHHVFLPSSYYLHYAFPVCCFSFQYSKLTFGIAFSSCLSSCGIKNQVFFNQKKTAVSHCMICFQKQNKGLNRPGVYKSKLGARNIGRYAKQCPTILTKTEVGVKKKKKRTYIVFLIGFKAIEGCGNTKSVAIPFKRQP